MIVCHCHGLTDREILTAATTEGRGPRDPCTRAGSACGGCTPLVDQLLAAHRARGDDRQAANPASRTPAPPESGSSPDL